MTQNFDVKEARKKAVQTLNQDGLLDIKIGIALLILSLATYLELCTDINISPFIIIVILLYIPIINEIRKRTTYPRIGYVDTRTNKQFQLIFIVSLVTLIAFLYLLFTSNTFVIPRSYIRALPALFMAGLVIVFLYFAQRYSFKRFFIYAILALVGCIFLYTFQEKLLNNLSYALFILSFFIILIGITTYIHFIISTPISANLSDERKSRIEQRKAQAAILQDGIEEIFLSLYFIVWIIGFYIFRSVNLLWLSIILLITSIIFGLLTLSMRKKLIPVHFENTKLVNYVVKMSALRIFGVMFTLNLFSFGIFLNSNSTNDPAWTAALILIGLGCYFFILAALYDIKRFYYIGSVSFLCILLYLLDKPQASIFILSSAILAVVLFFAGWISRTKFAHAIYRKEVQDGR